VLVHLDHAVAPRRHAAIERDQIEADLKILELEFIIVYFNLFCL
jgi:hypothetical protein